MDVPLHPGVDGDGSRIHRGAARTTPSTDDRDGCRFLGSFSADDPPTDARSD
jgi:hypothetical protein